jgi:hypothetical protein
MTTELPTLNFSIALQNDIYHVRFTKFSTTLTIWIGEGTPNQGPTLTHFYNTIPSFDGVPIAAEIIQPYEGNPVLEDLALALGKKVNTPITFLTGISREISPTDALLIKTALFEQVAKFLEVN